MPTWLQQDGRKSQNWKFLSEYYLKRNFSKHQIKINNLSIKFLRTFKNLKKKLNQIRIPSTYLIILPKTCNIFENYSIGNLWTNASNATISWIFTNVLFLELSYWICYWIVFFPAIWNIFLKSWFNEVKNKMFVIL